MKRPALRAGAALAALCLAAHGGCGYRLAGRNQLLPPDIKVIAVPPFENQTQRPEIEQRITEQIVATFIQRGGYATRATPEGADALLKGVVLRYDSTPVSVSAEGRATRYEVVINASVELTSLPAGKVLFRTSQYEFKKQYDVEGESLVFFDREILAINSIAKDFAESVVTSILEGF